MRFEGCSFSRAVVEDKAKIDSWMGVRKRN